MRISTKQIQYEKGKFLCCGHKGKLFDEFVRNKARTDSHSGVKPLQINSKPLPDYTDEARQNNVQGTVTLRVTFLANGQIGEISPVNGLPFGLTEKAIAAARKIRFEPFEKNGAPQSVKKLIQYSFTLY